MYILPKDLHKDTIDVIPYGFEVDIIKDCSSLQNDIADVFNVIDRECPSYVQTIEKVHFSFYSIFLSLSNLILTIFFVIFQFIRTGTELLNYHGYELNISDYLRNYI